ncbi:hypothetical protein LIER_27500 [Lithospermum erythrorhizon]|uniref:Uncharacterized protein n=1 Tax=Lithospermum erythrorhizon TaxID=34254 RepID=A0AAV3RCK3_LITER
MQPKKCLKSPETRSRGTTPPEGLGKKRHINWRYLRGIRLVKIHIVTTGSTHNSHKDAQHASQDHTWKRLAVGNIIHVGDTTGRDECHRYILKGDTLEYTIITWTITLP